MGDHRPFGPEMAVAPVLRVLRVAGPLRSDADAAGEADPAVDDEHFAVGAIVELVEVVPPRLVIAPDVHTGIEHLRQKSLVHLAAAR